MKRMNKLLALVLALAMVASLVVVLPAMRVSAATTINPTWVGFVRDNTNSSGIFTPNPPATTISTAAASSGIVFGGNGSPPSTRITYATYTFTAAQISQIQAGNLGHHVEWDNND